MKPKVKTMEPEDHFDKSPLMITLDQQALCNIIVRCMDQLIIDLENDRVPYPYTIDEWLSDYIECHLWDT